jgi:hypothetical protein
MPFFLERGQKGFMVGQNGSGKSEGMIWQLRHPSGWPVIILDTKFEDNFFKLSSAEHPIQVVNSFDQFRELFNQHPKHWPDYVLVRPNAAELQDPEALDAYMQHIYDHIPGSYVAVDEAVQLHKGSNLLSGYVNVIARGRSRDITLLSGAQRPARISRYLISEAKKFYAFYLLDRRDKKIMAEFVPDFDKLPPLPEKFWSYTYFAGDDRAILTKPVPFTALKEHTIHRTGWI